MEKYIMDKEHPFAKLRMQIMDDVENDNTVMFIGCYDEAIKIFKELSRYYADIFEAELFNDYCEDYVVEVWKEDGRPYVACYKESNTIIDAEIVYIMGHCDICNFDENDNVFVCMWNDPCDGCSGCDEERYEDILVEDGITKGIRQTWKNQDGFHTRYFYSNNPEEAERIVKEWSF